MNVKDKVATLTSSKALSESSEAKQPPVAPIGSQIMSCQNPLKVMDKKSETDLETCKIKKTEKIYISNCLTKIKIKSKEN